MVNVIRLPITIAGFLMFFVGGFLSVGNLTMSPILLTPESGEEYRELFVDSTQFVLDHRLPPCTIVAIVGGVGAVFLFTGFVAEAMAHITAMAVNKGVLQRIIGR